MFLSLVPFACSGGHLVGAIACMHSPGVESVSAFQLLTSAGAFHGTVDSTNHMRHDKVYIFNGKSDTVIKPGKYTRLTRRMPLVEQELFILPEHLSSSPGFSGVHGTRSVVLCVCFVDLCLSICTFSFGHCVVCSSSIYGF